MDLIIGITATLAILALAVIYGTDVVAAVVQRPVYAEIDDRSLVQVLGRGHYYGDRRLPIVGISGTVLTAATAGLSLFWGTVATGVMSLVSLLLLLVWLTLFARISAPINKVLTKAALGVDHPAARGAPRRVDPAPVHDDPLRLTRRNEDASVQRAAQGRGIMRVHGCRRPAPAVSRRSRRAGCR
ncbi:hypothetical protein [Microbacterium sp. NPDC058389]|uniref:hypothetical protein n=1 Tax=Microbacterium sp. NPDC058389 TaxID=3346475 RepID=UPI00364ED711